MADLDCDSELAVSNTKCGWVGEYGDSNWRINSVNKILESEDVKLKEMGLSVFFIMLKRILVNRIT
ncbi:hypothetical protein ACM55M_09640 [Flavobacterium sp. ZT3R25]|uniref:hypothetical protein n=1 Tax=Flavobacterium galactosi TaxID=3398735 RepID=UPI003A85C60E